MKKITVQTETSGDMIWGSLTYNDNLVVAHAKSLEKMASNLMESLKLYEGLYPTEVEFTFEEIKADI